MKSFQRISWNKNRKMNDYPQVGFQKGHKVFPNNPTSIGKHWEHTEEAKKKMRENHSSLGMLGKKQSLYQKETMRGNKYAWKGGIIKNERNDPAYHIWVKKVKKRDKNQCIFKGQNCSGYCIVHHILSWREYPELRYEVKNGITLCQYHHPRKRVDEQRLIPFFQTMVESKELI